MTSQKQSLTCKLLANTPINSNVFRLDFAWSGAVPKAGQFFMLKPKRSGVFLGRPIAVASWDKSGIVRFIIEMVGKGTQELSFMNPGEMAELIGPLGKAWTDFLPQMPIEKPIALVGGGIGIAPLTALFYERPGHIFDVYSGFKTGFASQKEKDALLGIAFREAYNVIIATEDGTEEQKGFIHSFLEPKKYSAVCACGPKPMMKAVADLCRNAGVLCFASMDQRMACGVGACLGCTVKTTGGNKRCCADGPVFNAEELNFDE